jgi:hypothetical protein
MYYKTHIEQSYLNEIQSLVGLQVTSLIISQKNWWSALHYCRQYGMELLSLETKEEENNLAKQLKAEKKNGDHGNVLYKV